MGLGWSNGAEVGKSAQRHIARQGNQGGLSTLAVILSDRMTTRATCKHLLDYIYIYIYIYVCVCIYIYTHLSLKPKPFEFAAKGIGDQTVSWDPRVSVDSM